MTVNPRFMPTLKAIFDATAAGNRSRQNTQNPAIRSLAKEGLIDQMSASDATNHAEYEVSEVGAAEFGGLPAPADIAFTQEPAVELPVAIPATEPVHTDLTSKPTGIETMSDTAVNVEDAKRKYTPRPVPGAVHPHSRVAIAAPPARKPITRDEKYDFASLEAPIDGEPDDSFFVEATDEQPNPAKYLSSTVGSANKRYAGEGRKFKVVAVAHDTEHGKPGARVIRTA